VVNTMNELNRAEMKDDETRTRELIHEEHHEILSYLKSIQRKMNSLEKRLDEKEQDSEVQ